MVRQSEERRVIKGTMVIDVVKTIKGFRDINWNQFLSPQAQELFSQKILPSNWYPFEPVLSCITAIYKILGKGDPGAARAWGKINSKRLFETTYKNVVAPGAPLRSLEKLALIISTNFFHGMKFEVEQRGGQHLHVEVHDDDPRTEPVYYFILGWLDALSESMPGVNIKAEIVKKHWQGDPVTVLDIRWE